MNKLELSGKWSFHEVGRGKWFDAAVPGSNIADLIENDIIPHPYYDENEMLVQWIGERDWEYAREFTLSQDMLKKNIILLELDGLDTLAEVFINDKLVAKTDNSFISHSFDIKNYVSRLTNKIRIKFRSPIALIEKHLENTPLFPNKMGMTGASFLRKPTIHFGWSNAPILPISGITGGVRILGYDDVKIEKLIISQKFVDSFATITANVLLKGNISHDEDNKLHLTMTVTEPNTSVLTNSLPKLSENNEFSVAINSPELWTTYDRLDEDESPKRYNVEINLYRKDTLVDSVTKRIGLRTLTIDREKDEYGRKFDLVLNGKRMLVKGAVITAHDVIHPSFDVDTVSTTLDAMMDANINMVRVFAGSGYESEEFYEMCDERGLLVWQDMPFSRYEYPLGAKEFQHSIAKEISTIITRLHSHPSLAVLCGSHEIEHRLSKFHIVGKKGKVAQKFFYDFIPTEINKIIDNINYIPGTPLSNKFLDRVNGDKQGTAHLWDIWRGMRSISKTSRHIPRFCGEFGMASMPSIKTIYAFSEKETLDMQSEEVHAHQKYQGGNDRIMFYVSTRFRVPKNVEDLIYYSQLTQAEYYKEMVEHLRRNMRRCSGVMMAYGNACWPGIDCAMVDYLGNYKAVMYKAKLFNSAVIITLRNKNGVVKVDIINDLDETINANVKWHIETFDGDKVAIGAYECELEREKSTLTATLNLKEFIKDNNKDRVLVVELYDEDGSVINREIMLFVPNKLAAFPDPILTTSVTVARGIATINVKAMKFARYVKLTKEDTCLPFSDNYFDMLAGEECVVSIPVDKGVKAAEIIEQLSVKSIANIEQKGNVARDMAKNVGVLLSPYNILDALVYKIKR